jgi:hypothetical protein
MTLQRGRVGFEASSPPPNIGVNECKLTIMIRRSKLSMCLVFVNIRRQTKLLRGNIGLMGRVVR